MIIKGDRRGRAKDLASHLLRRDTNEDVTILELTGYPANHLKDRDLRAVLNIMAAQGKAKGKMRALYHSIIAPQKGEILSHDQLQHAVASLAKNLGFEGHQRAIVEHRKDGRQHFHVVFSILHPLTGKQTRLGLTRRIQWRTARQLEQELGLKPVASSGRSARLWEHQRGQRSGIDPGKMREQVTAIYHGSATGLEFISNLKKAGYRLSKGKNKSYVLVDKAGDVHGLLRRIEGATLKALRTQFPDLESLALPGLTPITGALKGVRKAKAMLAIKHKPPLKERAIRSASRPLIFAPSRAPQAPAPRRSSSRAPRSYESIKALITALRAKTDDHTKRPQFLTSKKEKQQLNEIIRLDPQRSRIETAELLEWAWRAGRTDVLAQFGIILAPDHFEP